MRRSLAIAALLAVAVACSQKRSSQATGGGVLPPPSSPQPAQSPYSGQWTMYNRATSGGDGTCEHSAWLPVGGFSPDANGNFVVCDPEVGCEREYVGTLDLKSGAITLTTKGLGDCGPQNGTGQ